MTYDYNDADACDTFHATQIRTMQTRLIEHLAQGNTTDMTPEPLVGGAALYTGQAQLDQERSQVFERLPLLAGLSTDMPNPGDVMLFDAAGPPIVITRDKSGKVHAFLNMCMHRGASVAAKCGNANLLVCRFHGWSYDLNGKLAAIPGKEGFEGVDPSARGLVRVPVAQWHGLIFVIARPGDDEIDVERFLGDLAPQLAMLKLAKTKPVKTSILHTKANWKLMLDTHGEAYHFACLHPNTIAPSAIANVAVYDRYGPHYRVSFAQRTHADLIQREDPGSDAGNYSSCMLLFPNTIIFSSTFNLGKTTSDFETTKLDTANLYFGIFRLFPGATPGDSATYMATYRPTVSSPLVAEAAWPEMHDFIEKVLIEEDYDVAAEQHRNLSRAPPDHQVIYGRNEAGIQYFNEEIRRATAAG